MLGLIAVTLTLGFSAPESALKLRGGGEVSTGTLSTTMSTLNIVTGVAAFVAPKTNLKGYGMDEKDFTDDVKAFMRLLAAGQIVNGATLVESEFDMDNAAIASLVGTAVVLLANIPSFELLNAPKGPIAAWIVILAGLGKLAREGKISSSAANKWAGYFQIVTSVQEILAPKLTFDAYKMGEPTKMARVLFDGFVWNKLGNGLFVILGKKSGKALGLSASCAAAAFNCFKMSLGGAADEAGFDKKGPLVWGVVQAGIAALAYKNSQA
jgi:hypothetical protein